MAVEPPHLMLQRPKPGKKLRVIGAGLPRTGTNSFCAAVSILLDGPSYHIGVQTVLAGNDETTPRTWIRLMRLWPPSSPAQQQEFTDLLTHELDGFVCIADPPGSLLVPELLALYPDALVLCTTRDKEKWAVSMEAVRKLIIPFWISRVLYFWIPVLHLMPTFWYLLPEIFVARHGETMTDRAAIYRIHERHHAWLEEVVPRERLFYVDVKEGWAPLCEALGVEKPEGVEFPRLNDTREMEELFKGFAVKGLQRWGMVLAALVVVVGGLVWFWR